MGYEDRTYYSQGKLRVHAPSDATISVYSDNEHNYSQVSVNGQCEFTLPGTRYYKVAMNNVYKTSVAMSYGTVKDITIGV